MSRVVVAGLPENSVVSLLDTSSANPTNIAGGVQNALSYSTKETNGVVEIQVDGLSRLGRPWNMACVVVHANDGHLFEAFWDANDKRVIGATLLGSSKRLDLTTVDRSLTYGSEIKPVGETTFYGAQYLRDLPAGGTPPPSAYGATLLGFEPFASGFINHPDLGIEYVHKGMDRFYTEPEYDEPPIESYMGASYGGCAVSLNAPGLSVEESLASRNVGVRVSAYPWGSSDASGDEYSLGGYDFWDYGWDYCETIEEATEHWMVGYWYNPIGTFFRSNGSISPDPSTINLHGGFSLGGRPGYTGQFTNLVFVPGLIGEDAGDRMYYIPEGLWEARWLVKKWVSTDPEPGYQRLNLAMIYGPNPSRTFQLRNTQIEQVLPSTTPKYFDLSILYKEPSEIGGSAGVVVGGGGTVSVPTAYPNRYYDLASKRIVEPVVSDKISPVFFGAGL